MGFNLRAFHCAAPSRKQLADTSCSPKRGCLWRRIHWRDKRKTEKRSFRATLTCQLIQLGAVATLYLLQSKLSTIIFVPVLSSSAALQITSFGKPGPWSFITAMTTGNLRSATTSLVSLTRGEKTPVHRGQAVGAGTARLAFASGALAGAVITRWHPDAALLYVLLLLSAATLLTWHERHRSACLGRRYQFVNRD